jgi:hypothetical protein
MIATAVAVNSLLNRLVTGPPAKKTAFVPGKTDVFEYVGMKFMKTETEFVEVTFGWKGALTKSLPTWVGFLLEKIPGRQRGPLADMVTSPTDVLDARSRSMPFKETGFTLIELDSPSKTTSWSDKEDVKSFHDEITPHLQKLYPEATRFEFANQVVRGKLMAQPIPVNGVHTDYHWNDTARAVFFDKHGIDPNNKEVMSIFGKLDTDEDEMRVMLGIWKPIDMSTPVCDKPMAVMDASTFRVEDERPYKLHIDFSPFFTYDNLIAGMVHHPDQRWYYHSFQTTKEVLVFNQYVKGKHWSNMHGAFANSNCPADTEPRVSVEMRVAVFFPKDGTHKAMAPSSCGTTESPVCTPDTDMSATQ